MNFTIMKSIEELINEMDQDYLNADSDIRQSDSFGYMAYVIKNFRERWQEKIKPYSPNYYENMVSGRKLDYRCKLHNHLCDKIALLKRTMTNF